MNHTIAALWVAVAAALAVSCSDDRESALCSCPDARCADAGVGAPEDAATPEAAPATDQGPVELTVGIHAGVYSLAAEVANLSLDADGSFHWGSCGCDYSAVGMGIWHDDGDHLALWPLPGQLETFWTRQSSAAIPVRDLQVWPGDAPGELRITGVDETTSADFEQRWVAGRICFVCSAPPKTVPCAGPLPLLEPCAGP